MLVDVVEDDEDDREVVLQQGDGTVFEGTSSKPFDVKIGKLLDLQGSFEGNGQRVTLAEDKAMLSTEEGLGNSLALWLETVDCHADAGGETVEGLDDLLATDHPRSRRETG